MPPTPPIIVVAKIVELRSLEQNKQVLNTSKLASLSQYIDNDGLLRVGGRLPRADIAEKHGHPILLPSRHHVTSLTIKKERVRLHHCGSENLLCPLRSRYWPLSGRHEVQKVTRSCLKGFRNRPKTPEIIIGDFQSERVRKVLRPIVNAGVDYAGPLRIRKSRRRGLVHTSKAWIAVLTWFATKAIYLELVTDLSTESFFGGAQKICRP